MEIPKNLHLTKFKNNKRHLLLYRNKLLTRKLISTAINHLIAR